MMTSTGYQLTRLEDVTNPSPDQQAFMDMLGGPTMLEGRRSSLYDVVVEHGKQAQNPPPNRVSLFVAAFKKNHPGTGPNDNPPAGKQYIKLNTTLN